MEFLADLGQLAFSFGLWLDGPLFDFELGFFAAVGAFALGPLDDLAGFGFGVAAPQAVEQLDADERQHGSDGGRQQNSEAFRHGIPPIECRHLQGNAADRYGHRGSRHTQTMDQPTTHGDDPTAGRYNNQDELLENEFF